VVVDIVDDKGVPVPYANNLVNFELKGPAKLIGVENGDIIDLNPHKVAYRKAFNGKCLAIIQSDGNSGEIIVKANSEGLKSQTINIIVE
jgi:beta-galactosidase